jgi:endonuclease YncB( thermonuclease family)
MGAIAFVIGFLVASSAWADIIGTASVIDGDTIEIHGQRIRFHGIDAPESGQSCKADGVEWRCGQKASLTLADFIGPSPVTCQEQDVDRYGRIVAVCSVRSEDIEAWMVRNGWALAYRQYSQDYVDEETEAQVAGRGIWRGEFVAPWDWRRGKRLQATAIPDSDNGCLIKGNISSSGERIYHVPGGQYYGPTKISSSKGEQWFCTEADAVAAGWRKAKR